MACRFTRISSKLRLWPFGASLLSLALLAGPFDQAHAQVNGAPGSSPGPGGPGGTATSSPIGDGGDGGDGGTNGAGTAGGGPNGGAASTGLASAGGGGAESGGGGGSAGAGTGGGGGGGGARGITGNFVLVVSGPTGGNGGAGGDGVGPNSTDGGGGGGGGNALVQTGTGPLNLVSTATGGNGGAGGASGAGNGFGGDGGAGGNGIVVTAAGATINVNAAVTGGNGGAGGAGPGLAGAAGAGGFGIIGLDLTVNLASTVTGGLSGDGVTRNSALVFSGFSNLNLNAGFGIVGGINVAVGTLQITPAANATLSSVISGAGAVTFAGGNTLTLTAANTYTGGSTISGGTVAIQNAAALGTNNVRFNNGTLRSDITATVANGFIWQGGATGTIVAANGQTFTLTGGISIFGNATALRFGETGGTGIIDADFGVGVFNAPSVYTADILGGTFRSNSNTSNAILFEASATNVSAGATVEINAAGGFAGIRNLQSAGDLVIASPSAVRIGGGVQSGNISGTSALTVATPNTIGILSLANTGFFVLSGTGTYTGGTTIQTGATFQLGAGGATGSILGNVANSGTLIFNRSNAYSFDGVISGTGAVNQIGGGTTTLTAANTYTGATGVTAGTLLVNGSIATSSGLTAAAGTTIGGIGTLPTSVINGTLSPGNSIGTINVAGNLTFAGTSVYLVEVGTAAADRTNVTGTATLGGTVRAVPVGQPLSFGTRYTIVNAAGGVTGTFSSLQNLLGGAVNPVLSYDTNNVFLTLNAIALAPTLTGLTQNQQAVVNGFDRGIAAGGNANPFLPLFLLPPGAVPAALDQLSGQVHTGAQGLGVLVSSQFLNVMLDPFALDRTPGTNPALAYAPDALAGLPGVVAATQAADLATAEVIDTRRFAVWAAAFGSDGRIGGDRVIGSVRRSERSAGIAAGVDFRVAPGTLAGFALAGGGADASLSNGLGSLSADVFQAGLYAMTRFGFIDLRGALAYSRLEIDSARAVPALGIAQLNGSYDADVWSGRLEAAVPLTFAGLSFSPVAAIQAQSVRTGAFAETAPGGGAAAAAAALLVDGRTSTTTRGELGVRLEGRFGAPGFEATAFARLAWAHYFERDANVGAAFIGLPGSNFTVIGARPDRDSALISTGLDVRITPQLSIGARFDGEFSENVSQYAGTARVRFEF